MAKYLDKDGVIYYWSKIKNYFAPKASPEFTGTPIAPTPATSDDSTKIATTAYVQNVVKGIEGATYSLTQSQADGHILRFTGSDGTDEEITIPDNDTTYSAATNTTDGLMSSADKSKLEGIAAGAQQNVIEGIQKNGTDLSISNKKVNITVPTKTSDLSNDSNYVADPDYVHTDNNYTTAEKNKLAGIDAGANKTVVDASLSASSTNPVQNKAINTALGNKVDKVSGKGLSTNDYTTAEKDKLAGFSDASNYALKSEISGVYKFKGSVAAESLLPTTGQTVGDVYDIQSASSYGSAGMNVAWNGTAWDALGEMFTISSITNAEIDQICV